MSERYQRNKIITASNLIAAITLCVFLLGKLFLQQSEQGQTFPSFVDLIAFLGFGSAGSMAMAVYGYQAWSLDLHSFIEWFSSQQIIPNDSLQNWYSSFPGWNIRSQYRVIGPIGSLGLLAVAVIAGIGLFVTIRP